MEQGLDAGLANHTTSCNSDKILNNCGRGAKSATRHFTGTKDLKAKLPMPNT